MAKLRIRSVTTSTDAGEAECHRLSQCFVAAETEATEILTKAKEFAERWITKHLRSLKARPFLADTERRAETRDYLATGD